MTTTRTVLVDNFFYTPGAAEPVIVPHLGLMSLGATLEAAGHQVDLLDPKLLFARQAWERPGDEFYDCWAGDLLARSADVIGFTAYGRSLPHVIRVAQRIKALRPRQKIALGGPHATIVGARILEEFPLFDVVVRYEAEPTIVDIVTSLAGGADLGHIPNLIFRSGQRIIATAAEMRVPDVEALPDPALHLYPLHERRLEELSIEAGRGCPYACTFCSTANFFQRRYRLKSSMRLVREMVEARDRYGVHVFNLNHDLFGLVRPKLEEFCRNVRGLDLEWKCSMRPDTLDVDLVDTLAEAGCRHIYFGVESGSERLQRVLKKRLDLHDTRRIVRAVVERGMHVSVSFITGFPEETEEDQDATLALLGHLMAVNPQLVHPQLHILSPEPGSALAEGNRGYAFDGFGPEIDEPLDEDLITRHPDVFSIFYHYPSRVPRERVLLASTFVSHIIPILGYPLTTHIASTQFNGNLAAMFRRIIEESGRVDLHRIGAVTEILWRGVQSLLRRLRRSERYLSDAVRFSRILDRARRLSRGNEAGGAWIASFGHDMAPLLRAIVDRPTTPMVPASVARKRWHVLQIRSADDVAIATISASVVQGLSGQADHLGARYVPLTRSSHQ